MIHICSFIHLQILRSWDQTKMRIMNVKTWTRKCALLIIVMITAAVSFGQYADAELIIEVAGTNGIGGIDIDNDGDDDLLTLKSTSSFNGAYYYENLDGQGTFSLPKPFEAMPEFAEYFLEFADINGDDLIDIVLGSGWIKNNGTLATWEHISYDSNDGSRKIPVDYDNDGDIDLLASGIYYPGVQGSEVLFWKENTDGLGNFTDHPPFTNIGFPSGFTAVEVLDINNDGLQDVVAAYKGAGIANGINIYQQSQTGEMFLYNSLPIAFGFFGWDIAVVDHELTGFQSFVLMEGTADIQDEWNNWVFLYKNQFGIFEQPVRINEQNGARSLETSDINGDEIDDLIVTDFSGNYLFDGSYISITDLCTYGIGASGSGNVIGFGDFNGDGLTDVAEYNHRIQETGGKPFLRWFSNNLQLPLNYEGDFGYHLVFPRREVLADWDESGSYARKLTQFPEFDFIF